MQNLIQLSGLSKWFEMPSGKFYAVRNINLAIQSGEYVAIVGKSGSGKSTLLNLITGIDRPSEGTVVINQMNIGKLKESELAKWRGKNIGIVFQFFQLIPTLTVFENILLAMEFVNIIPAKDRKSRATHLLEEVGILCQKDKLPAALSGGEQQRAAIARALANDPPVLLADEPTGNLDTKSTEVILSLFAALVKEGKTVMVVTHDKNPQISFKRMITISDGAIIEDTQDH